jgi:hypothetical protein
VVLTAILEFEATRTAKIDLVTSEVLTAMVDHLTAKIYSVNTIAKMVKIIKTIVKSAGNTAPIYKISSVKVESIYLNESELTRLAAVDLSEDKTLDICRDVFLIGCYTAQRYSDYHRITPEMIRAVNDVKVLELIQQKTGAKVMIPIRPELDAILSKYGYHLPHTGQQQLNDSMKIVGGMAGITEPVQLEASKGGMIVKTTIPKNELIKSHTARRSACTNLYLAGINTLAIMKLSGQKTESEFMKYIRISVEENAVILAKDPYFNKPVMKIAR